MCISAVVQKSFSEGCSVKASTDASMCILSLRGCLNAPANVGHGAENATTPCSCYAEAQVSHLPVTLRRAHTDTGRGGDRVERCAAYGAVVRSASLPTCVLMTSARSRQQFDRSATLEARAAL